MLVNNNRLQGPSITLHLQSRRYTLPIALLCAHSNYFRTEIMRLMHHAGGKKRKLGDTDTDTEICAPEDKTGEEKMKQGLSLRLDDIEHGVFGLFVKFMYTGGYVASVDAKGYVQTSMASGSTTNHNPTTLGSTTTIGVGMANPTSIPPSIHAYLLAHRLQSISFMNHTLYRIYHGIGEHFVLTPGLVGWVWANTCPCPPPTPNTTPPSSTVTSTPPLPTSPTPTTAPPPAPLRALLLDVLTTHWPSHHTHIIARDQKAAWNAVFEEHGDLRRGMMFGMQEGGKVKDVQGYFANVGTVMGVRRQTERKQWGEEKKQEKKEQEKKHEEKDQMGMDVEMKVEGDEMEK
jgi:hypothetical protein